MSILDKFFKIIERVFGEKKSYRRRKKTRRKSVSHSSPVKSSPRRRPTRRPVSKVRSDSAKAAKRPARERSVPPKKSISASAGVPVAKNSFGVLVGEVTHFFPKIQVVVLNLTHGGVKTGDQIRVKGKETDFTQKISSLQIESRDVKNAAKGKLAGLKVVRAAGVGDKVYRM